MARMEGAGDEAIKKQETGDERNETVVGGCGSEVLCQKKMKYKKQRKMKDVKKHTYPMMLPVLPAEARESSDDLQTAKPSSDL